MTSAETIANYSTVSALRQRRDAALGAVLPNTLRLGSGDSHDRERSSTGRRKGAEPRTPYMGDRCTIDRDARRRVVEKGLGKSRACFNGRPGARLDSDRV